MSRSPLALAALSTLAVPGLDVHHVQPVVAPDGFDSAIAIDGEKRRWVVRAPHTLAAGAALEAEAAFLAALEDYVDDGRLPFEVPRAAGFVPLPDGGRAIVYPELPGHPVKVERIVPGPGLSASLGRSIAALHELPVSLVENAGLPVYSAQEYRERRLSEVDEAAATGRVPATLLRRWEQALENVALWRFRPTLTHTGLSADTLLVRAGQVSAISDFFEVQVGDPADDLAWLLVTAPQESVDSILEAYQLRRTELIDPHLVDRALLASELALARWLLHGVRNGYPDVVEDAVSMLADLDREATEVGAFSVATTPPAAPATTGPSRTAGTSPRTGATGRTGSVRATGTTGSVRTTGTVEAERAGRAAGATGSTRTSGAAGTARRSVDEPAATPSPSAAQAAAQAAALAEVAAGRLAPPPLPPPSLDGDQLEEGVRLPDYDKTQPRQFEDVSTAAYTAAVVAVGAGSDDPTSVDQPDVLHDGTPDSAPDGTGPAAAAGPTGTVPEGTGPESTGPESTGPESTDDAPQPA